MNGFDAQNTNLASVLSERGGDKVEAPDININTQWQTQVPEGFQTNFMEQVCQNQKANQRPTG